MLWMLWRLFGRLLWKLLWRVQIVLHCDLRQYWLRWFVPWALLGRLHNLVPDRLRLLRNELHKRIKVRR